ncbi:transporter substrate-binding domain-containing protein [Temperatibacter marinus]|uniref:Transporter substrate-binding domain-containing protein n=1 Tax=Temperatibacter marinus TaxID=1456591 RepID=A0AA52HAC2_9PROT|nr:transporter substrate-binding domain-containing protein [Temperatibacter marinus]WND04101.1 transporter substrate-binding domain-containing protein [Temperatibacter marinus]
MKTIQYTLVALASLISTCVTAEDIVPRVHLVTEVNHPYFYYQEDSKEPTGIGYVIVTELMRRSGIDYELTVLPWLRALRKTEMDPRACLFNMNRTPAREARYRWIGPLAEGGLAIFARPGSPEKLGSLEELKGRIVIGKTDSLSLKGLAEEYGATVIVARKDRQAAMAFYKGRADFWAGGLIDVPLAARHLGFPVPEIALKRSSASLNIGCNLKLDDRLYDRMSKAFKTMGDFRETVVSDWIVISQ